MREDRAVLSTVRIDIDRRKLVRFCRRHHIRQLALFGSVLHEDFAPASDVDFLVEFQPGHVPGMFQLVAMERELSESIGRKADLRTLRDLCRHFRDEVAKRRSFSMKREDRVRIVHMFEAAQKALSFARERKREDLESD